MLRDYKNLILQPEKGSRKWIDFALGMILCFLGLVMFVLLWGILKGG